MPAMSRRWAALMLVAASPVAADRDAKRSKVIGPDGGVEETLHSGTPQIAKLIEERAAEAQRTARELANRMGQVLASENQISEAASLAERAGAETASLARHGDKKALLWDDDGYCCSESSWDNERWCYLPAKAGTCNEYGFARSQRKLPEGGDKTALDKEKLVAEKAKAACGKTKIPCPVELGAPAIVKIDPNATNCVCMHSATDNADTKVKVREYDFDTYDQCLGVTVTADGASINVDDSCQSRCGEITKTDITIGEAVFASHQASACILPKDTKDITKDTKGKCMCADFSSTQNVTKTAVQLPDRFDPLSTRLEDAQRLASCYATCPQICEAKKFKHGFCVVPGSIGTRPLNPDSGASGLGAHVAALVALGAWLRL